MKKLFIGSSPVSSIGGYVLSALMLVLEKIDSGEVSVKKLVIVFLIAVIGRLLNDNMIVKNKQP